MIELTIPTLWFMLITSFIVGVIAVELDLRRNLKIDPSRAPMIFGKDILLKDKQND